LEFDISLWARHRHQDSMEMIDHRDPAQTHRISSSCSSLAATVATCLCGLLRLLLGTSGQRWVVECRKVVWVCVQSVLFGYRVQRSENPVTRACGNRGQRPVGCLTSSELTWPGLGRVGLLDVHMHGSGRTSIYGRATACMWKGGCVTRWPASPPGRLLTAVGQTGLQL
jgi:hypothetical protein